MHAYTVYVNLLTRAVYYLYSTYFFFPLFFPSFSFLFSVDDDVAWQRTPPTSAPLHSISSRPDVTRAQEYYIVGSTVRQRWRWPRMSWYENTSRTMTMGFPGEPRWNEFSNYLYFPFPSTPFSFCFFSFPSSPHLYFASYFSSGVSVNNRDFIERKCVRVYGRFVLCRCTKDRSFGGVRGCAWYSTEKERVSRWRNEITNSRAGGEGHRDSTPAVVVRLKLIAENMCKRNK